MKALTVFLGVVMLFVACSAAPPAHGQSSGTLEGTVNDPSGAVIAGATVAIQNPISKYVRSTISDSNGRFHFANVPFNPYHVSVIADGFSEFTADVEIRSQVGVSLNVALTLAGSATTVTVEGGADLIEKDSTFHTDVDREMFQKMPLESSSSAVSSLVTLTSPGVSADSNGLFHGLGDHASNSFSVDGQPITDQQSKTFSNQIPSDSIQSLEVISGAPPAEYGDKTSLVIKVTTRSGLGVQRPTGSVSTSYGSFGTTNAAFDLAFGGDKWGNFMAANGLNSSRFLDPPDFHAMHDKGNQENIFDRVDYQLRPEDTLRLNVAFTRSWFQTPNNFDNLHAGESDAFGNALGATDQRSQIKTLNIAPSWTRLLGTAAVFNFGAFVRHDQFHYYPSDNPFNDLGPANLQSETVSQDRTLTNAGLRSDISYVRGIHNLKAGALYQQTFLNESFGLGIVDPALNAPCLNAFGNPVTGFNDPAQCAPAGYQPNIAANRNAVSPFNPLLGCLDLTRPNPSADDGCGNSSSASYRFIGHTDVKELALYLQDTITKGNWSFNLGMRGDLYNGLSVARQAEPRLGIAYNIKPASTVLRISYARTLETPFNENLILSNSGCNDAVVAALVPCVPSVLRAGWRNEFHAGLQQAFGKHLVIDGEYIWKYTHGGYDFSVLGSTPITFPIEWNSSKIPGFAIRASVPEFHGLSALVVMSSVAARFFPPQNGGLGVTVGQNGSVFRIDHDERFNQTTHLQYQPWKRGPWVGFNWRYDSGMVAGSVPFAADTTTPVDLSGLTATQQIEAGLFCGSVVPTLTAPLTSCSPSQYGSTLISIPAPGTENDDKNPPRIAARNLLDLAVGHDNLFHGDRYRWSLRLTAVNLTNKEALYNFLSTFSGTHYVTPRAYTAELGFHF
jgi:hypothetical protein